MESLPSDIIPYICVSSPQYLFISKFFYNALKHCYIRPWESTSFKHRTCIYNLSHTFNLYYYIKDTLTYSCYLFKEMGEEDNGIFFAETEINDIKRSLRNTFKYIDNQVTIKIDKLASQSPNKIYGYINQQDTIYAPKGWHTHNKAYINLLSALLNLSISHPGYIMNNKWKLQSEEQCRVTHHLIRPGMLFLSFKKLIVMLYDNIWWFNEMKPFISIILLSYIKINDNNTYLFVCIKNRRSKKVYKYKIYQSLLVFKNMDLSKLTYPHVLY